MLLYKKILVISCLILLIKFFKGSNRYQMYLFLFLLFATTFEIGVLQYFKKIYQNNIDAYNFFAISCIISYIYVYLLYFKNHRFAYILKLVLIGYTIFSTTLFYLNFGSNQLINYTYLLGLTISVALSIMYLKNMISQEGVQFYKESLFYFSIGLIVFFVTSFPLLTLFDLLIKDNYAMKSYSELLQIGNIFLTLGYLGAAICTKKEAQYIG